MHQQPTSAVICLDETIAPASVHALTASLRHQPGVRQVEESRLTQCLVLVEYDPEATTPSAFAAMLDRSGFDASIYV